MFIPLLTVASWCPGGAPPCQRRQLHMQSFQTCTLEGDVGIAPQGLQGFPGQQVPEMALPSGPCFFGTQLIGDRIALQGVGAGGPFTHPYPHRHPSPTSNTAGKVPGNVPPPRETNALVRATAVVVSAPLGTVSYVALYEYGPWSEQRQVLCLSNFGTFGVALTVGLRIVSILLAPPPPTAPVSSEQ